MSYCSEAYLHAVGGEESVPVDEEDVNHQFNVLLKLDELPGYLDDAPRHSLGIFHTLSLSFSTPNNPK